jgi:hypothetical protein
MSFNLTPLSDLTPSPSPTTPPELTTLRSLQRYASIQTELIESILQDPSLPNSDFQDSRDKCLAQLLRSIWEKDLESLDETEKVERGSDPVDDSLIVVPLDRDVMHVPKVMNGCWNFEHHHRKVLIRSEFKEAEEFAISSCGEVNMTRVLMVAGQSGIGLSPF